MSGPMHFQSPSAPATPTLVLGGSPAGTPNTNTLLTPSGAALFASAPAPPPPPPPPQQRSAMSFAGSPTGNTGFAANPPPSFSNPRPMSQANSNGHHSPTATTINPANIRPMELYQAHFGYQPDHTSSQPNTTFAHMMMPTQVQASALSNSMGGGSTNIGKKQQQQQHHNNGNANNNGHNPPPPPPPPLPNSVFPASPSAVMSNASMGSNPGGMVEHPSNGIRAPAGAAKFSMPQVAPGPPPPNGNSPILAYSQGPFAGTTMLATSPYQDGCLLTPMQLMAPQPGTIISGATSPNSNSTSGLHMDAATPNYGAMRFGVVPTLGGGGNSTDRLRVPSPGPSPTLVMAAAPNVVQAQPFFTMSAAPPPPVAVAGPACSSGNVTPRERTIDVYDPDFKDLLTIPDHCLLHRPHPSLGVSRLVLCRNFSLDPTQNKCQKGDLCKFVHADTSTSTRCSIHVNYAWRSIELCTYPRLPAGDMLTVLAPNERPPSEQIPSERILLTRGSATWREHTAPLSHCAHYYFNRMCNRGERCNFIHAAHVDPTVQGDFRRAPAPSTVAPVVSRGASTSSAGTAPTNPNNKAFTPPPPTAYAPSQLISVAPPPTGAQPPNSAPMVVVINTPGGGATPLSATPNASLIQAQQAPQAYYLMVPPQHGGAMVSNTNSSNNSRCHTPVSPMGSLGPVDWSFYGDLETNPWGPEM